MAISKAVENEYGAEFSYHKLREVRIINDEKIGIQLTMTVFSWINRQARIDGKRPTVRQCIIEGADFALTPFYALLKAKFPDFSSGDDDYDNSFKTERTAPAELIEQTGTGNFKRRREQNNNENETAPTENAEGEDE